MSITDHPPVPSGAPGDWCLPGVERPVAVDAVPVVDAKADALRAAVQAILDDDPAGLADEVVLERQRALLPLIERLKVVALHGLRVIDARELHALDGAPTASAWMRVQPVAPDGITVQTARRLGSLRQAAAEAAAGRLSVRDASTIGAALGKVPADVARRRRTARVVLSSRSVFGDVEGGG